MADALQTTFEWEQDGAGGEHGQATFHFQNGSLSLRIDTFREAHALSQAIQAEMREVRHDARQGLINEIARIQP